MEHLNHSVLSLKDMANRKMAACLFQDSDILASVKNFRPMFFNDKALKVWRESVEDKMSDKISKIGLPEILAKLLIDTAKPMGLQVPRWKAFHEKYLFYQFDVPLLKKLCWTPTGALDYRKTAEELILFNDIDIEIRYKLSSLYCLEDYIPLFWKELPEEKKMYFYNEKGYFGSGELPLQFWWPYIIRGEQSELDNLARSYRYRIHANRYQLRNQPITFNQFAFQYSADSRSPLTKAAAEYFFQKLTQEEKEASLIRTTKDLLLYRYYRHGLFPKENVSEMLHYLLSVMTSDQQMQIFQEMPFEVSLYLLNWPLPDQFLESLDLLFNFLPERRYDSVLREMYESFKNAGYYFQILFQEFFLRIPCNLRKSFVDQECEESSYFAHILRSRDIKALETTFRSVDAATREGLVFSDLALAHFQSSISRGQWDVVEVCLREARLSKEYKVRLGEMKLKTRKWTRFFQFLDETDAPSKRCSEDETPTKTKMKNFAVRNKSKIN